MLRRFTAALLRESGTLAPVLLLCTLGPACTPSDKDDSTPDDTGVDTAPECGAGFVDQDGDGYGDPEQPAEGCEGNPGFSLTGDDCNDLVPSVHPGAFDAPCDGLDDDCDGAPERGTAFADLEPHDSIQAALDAVATGGTVWVCPIDHRENLVVPSGLQVDIIGASGATLTPSSGSMPAIHVDTEAEVWISQVDIAGGTPPIQVADADLRSSAVDITDGQSGGGGCIDATYTSGAHTLELDSTTLSACEGDQAGGLMVEVLGGSVEIALRNNTFVTSTSGHAGALQVLTHEGGSARLVTSLAGFIETTGDIGGVLLTGDGEITAELEVTAWSDTDSPTGCGGLVAGEAVSALTLRETWFRDVQGAGRGVAVQIESATVTMEGGGVVKTWLNGAGQGAVSLGEGAIFTSTKVDWGTDSDDNGGGNLVTHTDASYSWEGVASFVCEDGVCE